VKKVVLQNGQVLDADVVIVGAGITPNVELAKNLKISKTNGGIETDVFLKTSKNNVFSAGDVTR
jgi:3-phenylpropionate/trans-cinnamate dioxygenase ferredoxin reductase subunit